MLKTALLFIATALAEILGCFLPYLWLRRNGPIWLLLPAAADNQAVHCLHGATLDLKDSYTDALAVTELTVHGAKRFADLSQRLMTAMLAGLISRAISAEYAMQFQERIANIIYPFATLFERTHAAYQDAFE